MAVVDLGTEFALNVERDGKGEVMVFEGQAEVSLLNAAGATLRSERLNEHQAVDVDPRAGRIRSTPAKPEHFAGPPHLKASDLVLDPQYARVIRKAKPWGYWRFESLKGGRVPNEMAGGPPLRKFGPVQLAGEKRQNHCAVFKAKRRDQMVLLDGVWQPPDAGYAVELWVMPEAIGSSTLVALVALDDDRNENHSLILELTAQSRELLHVPGAVRYLHRWPPGKTGGVNVFSSTAYMPYRWHHLVAQKTGKRLELFLDGELTGAETLEDDQPSGAGRLLLGRLKERPQNPRQFRSFAGRLDEFAVYGRPLSPAEIKRHFELGTKRLRAER
jgi:hypothetical protein